MIFGPDRGVWPMRIEPGMGVEPMVFGSNRVLDL
jgi:hypothetical protein